MSRGEGGGAPIGNTNGTKTKYWSDEIKRQVLELSDSPEGRRKLKGLVGSLIERGMLGEIAALKEIGDRIDGRVPQGIVGKDDDTPIQVSASVASAPALSKEEWLALHPVTHK